MRDLKPHRDLWQAVLLQAMDDALLGVSANGTSARRATSAAVQQEMRIAATKRARAYLTRANDGLATVCHLAGLDPQAVMEHMRKRLADAPTPEELASGHKRLLTSTLPKTETAGRPPRRPNHYELDGEILSVEEWAKRIGVSPNTIRSRIYQSGWSIRDALTTPRNAGKGDAFRSPAFRKAAQKPKRTIATLTHDGLTLSFTQWAERTGISMRTIRTRHVAGWPVERILDTSNQRRKAEGAAE